MKQPKTAKNLSLNTFKPAFFLLHLVTNVPLNVFKAGIFVTLIVTKSVTNSVTNLVLVIKQLAPNCHKM